MKKAALKLGTWGAMLGMLAGLVELSIGSQIRPWIGDKENPVVLGIVTLLLSGMALAVMISSSRKGLNMVYLALTKETKLPCPNPCLKITESCDLNKC